MFGSYMHALVQEVTMTVQYHQEHQHSSSRASRNLKDCAKQPVDPGLQRGSETTAVDLFPETSLTSLWSTITFEVPMKKFTEYLQLF